MTYAKSWGQFEKTVRNKEPFLLSELDKFENAILVAGCQRSGTTILSRVVTQSCGVAKYKYTQDDELDAALILSGAVEHKVLHGLRYCFQTTYLNDSYKEYFRHGNYKLIWVLRNPVSVVNSMLSNWKVSALNRLFRHCGADLLDGSEKENYAKYGAWCFSKVKKACLSYNSKIVQLRELKSVIGADKLLVVEYDELVKNKDHTLPHVYEFIGLEYNPVYSDLINMNSVNKQKNLSRKKKEFVINSCQSNYLEALGFVSDFSPQTRYL